VTQFSAYAAAVATQHRRNNNNGETAPIALLNLTVNGVPTITTPSIVVAPAGLSTSVPGLKVSETGNTAGEFFVLTLSGATGLLSASAGGLVATGNGTNQLTISGSLDQVNAQLASLTITETTVGPDTITGRVGDGFGNGSGPFAIPVTGEKPWTSTVTSDPNNWNNAANWTTPGAPVAGQDIFIPQAGPQPIIFNGATGLIGGADRAPWPSAITIENVSPDVVGLSARRMPPIDPGRLTLIVSADGAMMENGTLVLGVTVTAILWSSLPPRPSLVATSIWSGPTVLPRKESVAKRF
jgi:hypothetical protein